MKKETISFSPDMIQAIREGNKTQTRRIIKEAPANKGINYRVIELDGWNWQVDHPGVYPSLHRDIHTPLQCPYGQIGDKLIAEEVLTTSQLNALNVVPGECRPWVSFCYLLIKDIRVEKLNDIKPDDCIAEGIWPVEQRKFGLGKVAIEAFRDLWSRFYGPSSWDANPWVWVIEFEVILAGAERSS